MFKRGQQIDGSVVLVTGASSGIGRAAARRFAESGADLVLTARSPEDIDRIALECQAHGSEVLTMLADVGDERQVQELAKVAIEHFGRIDAWINNAGVIAYGRFEDMPSEVFDGVIRTNLLGQVYGARAALEQFRRQGSGVLVNLASVWGRVTSPNVVPYVVSKHGIRAFSECLREGLAASEGTEDIHVVTVLPESVDTPIFQHAANYTGHEIKPVSPVIGVEHAAMEESEAEPSPGNVLEPEPELNRLDGGWRNGLGARAGRLAAGTVGLAAPVVATGLILHRARHKG